MSEIQKLQEYFEAIADVKSIALLQAFQQLLVSYDQRITDLETSNTLLTDRVTALETGEVGESSQPIQHF